ncbi:Zinc finger CCCH domain-containing protein 19 [Platanthera guangdongensis]|uniref:Zinc finger CCCH domain-containing protein 19 n=1 Tax=Platanthera guangdongensis TaxID=2320717 RepID=A0ABR2N062_9ASPA
MGRPVHKASPRRDAGCFSKANVDTVVIEIDYEEDADHKGPSNPVNRSEEKIWNYKDPSGNVQGPFSLSALRYWKEQGFFDEDFTIWRTQSHEDAIPLTVALIRN